ncbi:MAG: sulfatase-like hydrolase/transferase [Edaphobacter sp.]
MPHTRRDFIRTSVNAGIAGAFALQGGTDAFADAGKHSANGKGPSEATTARRPNILLLFPDQWRFDWMSSNPDLPIRTPNLDRLARTGTRFTNVLVNSPLCAPSRACLASGKEYGGTRVLSNQYDFPVNVKTFYSHLRDGGYHVLGCGKLDLAKAANWWGIDGKWRLPALGFSDGINNAGKIDQLIGYRLNNREPADPYLTYLNSRGLLQEHLGDIVKRMKGGYAATYPEPIPDEAYCDNWLGQKGLDLLDAAPKDKPWFLQVNWTGPHNPVDITARMDSSGVRGLNMPAPNGTNEYSPAINQTIRQNYTAMCENIDRVIGLYLDKLASKGELENTIVIFSSDHGEMLGDHGRWGKVVPYHPSASVPLIASGPGVKQGTTSSALVSLIDLAATFLDYAGVARPDDMDSLSFRSVLEGNKKRHRDVLLSALGGWQMVVDDQYKVIRGFSPNKGRNSPDWTVHSKEVQGLPPLVFDMAHDPKENRDLAAAMPQGAKRLLDMLPTIGCA